MEIFDCLTSFAAVVNEKQSAFSGLMPGNGTGNKFAKAMWSAFKWPMCVLAVVMIVRGGGASLWRAIWNSLK